MCGNTHTHIYIYTHTLYSPDSESYWGSYFKYRKRCLCALWNLDAGAAAGWCCRMFTAVCALEPPHCRCRVPLLLLLLLLPPDVNGSVRFEPVRWCRCRGARAGVASLQVPRRAHQVASCRHAWRLRRQRMGPAQNSTTSPSSVPSCPQLAAGNARLAPSSALAAVGSSAEGSARG